MLLGISRCMFVLLKKKEQEINVSFATHFDGVKLPITVFNFTHSLFENDNGEMLKKVLAWLILKKSTFTENPRKYFYPCRKRNL